MGDNQVTWKEITPVLAQALPEPAAPLVGRVAGAGTFAANRDVYILVTLVNAQGETDAQVGLVFKFVNTTLNDRFVVSPASPPQWAQVLAPQYVPTGYNVYEADVATGGGAPALAAYQKVNGAAVALNQNTNVNTTGTGAAPPTTNTALIVPAGNICSGLRYMVVLFVNRNGYISGMTTPSVVSFNGGANNLQLYGAHIPTGPAPSTAARICAFTPAGQLNPLAGFGISTAGPYFWISPQFPNGIFNLSAIPGGVNIADVVNGEQITATLINDNVSTTATFNFDDNYLKQTLQDVSAYFRKIQVTQVSDAYYSKSLKRVLYKSDLYPSGWYVSLQDDPESVYGDTGVVQAAENDGTRGTAAREFGGVLYLMKEKSGHTMTNISNDPANTKWDVKGAWKGSGPCGPRAVDVCTNFMCYVHRSGVYIFEGGTKPYRISKEIPITWKQINWAAKQTIWVMIDDETREIRIGVPFGQGVTTPNMVLKCSYEELPDTEATTLFSPPIHFSPYVGKEIATGSCYKWSVDDIAANLAIRAERQLTPPSNGWPPDFDLANSDAQILYASSNPDGHVDPVMTGFYDDNGQGIDSSVETACPPDDPQTGGNLLRPNRLGGVQLNIAGQGQGLVYVLALRGKDQKQGAPPVPAGKTQATAGTELLLKKPWIAGVPYSCGGVMTNERMRLRVTNNRRVGVAFDLKWACIYATPVTSARPN